MQAMVKQYICNSQAVAHKVHLVLQVVVQLLQEDTKYTLAYCQAVVELHPQCVPLSFAIQDVELRPFFLRQILFGGLEVNLQEAMWSMTANASSEFPHTKVTKKLRGHQFFCFLKNNSGFFRPQ